MAKGRVRKTDIIAIMILPVKVMDLESVSP